MNHIYYLKKMVIKNGKNGKNTQLVGKDRVQKP